MLEFLFLVVLGVVSAISALAGAGYIRSAKKKQRNKLSLEERRVINNVLDEIRGNPAAAERRYFLNEYVKNSKFQSPEEIWETLE